VRSPRYADLAVLPNGLPASWGVFGPDDEAGTANRLHPEALLAALRDDVRTGERITVSLPLDEPSPPFFGRAPYRHTIFDYSPVVPDDVLDNFYLQASTQWDGLRHRRDPDLGFYNGITAEEAGAGGTRLGVDVWAAGGGIIGRGVLIDVARWATEHRADYEPTERQEIGADVLQSVLDDQGSDVREGDIVMVRTGYMGRYLAAGPDERRRIQDGRASAGLAADESVVRFLWDHGVAAVALDNPAVEVLPHDPAVAWLHDRLIPMLGMVLGEFFDFEALATACAQDRWWSGLFVSVPLYLPGGVGSPANAVVVR
jgi:hypothetical protein